MKKMEGEIMDNKELKRKLEAGNFVRNNGKVLRTINILRHKYNELLSVECVLKDEGIEQWEYLDCINFLSMEGYIRMRRISDQEEIEELSQDNDYRKLEAKLTPKGIRLLAGGIEDNMIEV